MDDFANNWTEAVKRLAISSQGTNWYLVLRLAQLLDEAIENNQPPERKAEINGLLILAVERLE